ncbi:MAG: 50S ribosomal protein L3 [bacterium]
MVGLIGRKLGMTRIFGEDGEDISVTVLEVGPCFVSQIKTDEKDGYSAVQLGFKEKKEFRVTKPLQGHFAKAGIKPVYFLKEFRNFDIGKEIQLGQEIKADVFSSGDVVDVRGKTKGKGFQGVMKRHGFHGGQKTHGQSDRLRAPGSIGQSSYPSRVFKGMKMGGRTGNRRQTAQNLTVAKVLPEQNLLLVRGCVPGSVNGVIEIRKS